MNQALARQAAISRRRRRLVLFFVAAILTHLRARNFSPSLGLATGFLLLAVAALVLGLATA